MDYSQINEFHELYKKYDCNEMEYCGKLWHYTSVDGFLGIVKNNTLNFWFTRSDCLNDVSEGIHILDLYREACKELFDSNSISQEFYDLIKDLDIPSYQFINYPIPSDDENMHDSMLDYVPCDAYICSFSKEEDSLDMWRYYSKGNGGYGLEILSLLFDKYKEYESSDYDENAVFSAMHFYEVIYNDSEKIKRLRNIVLDVYSAYEKSNSSDRNEQSVHFILRQLKILQFQFKHECYSSEKECRFVYYVPRKHPENLKNPLPTIKYRTQNGMLIPYIEVVVYERDYLSDVLISPYETNSTSVKTTDDYLLQQGFKCKARHSELPVRR